MKTLIMFLLVSFSANAESARHKILLIDSQGEQSLEEIGEGGTDTRTILWDERTDGPLPKQMLLGAMKVERVDGEKKVSIDESLKAAAEAKIADKQAKEADARNKEVQAKSDCAALRAKIVDDTANATDVRKALKCLLTGR